MSARRERKSTRRYQDEPLEIPQSASRTPKRGLAVLPVVAGEGDATGVSPSKNGKTGGQDSAEGGAVEGKLEVEDKEEEEETNEAWDDFAAEYFEVVEQLPLELHRNFALLRELDEQTQRHTADLLGLIKRYAGERIEEAREAQEAREAEGVQKAGDAAQDGQKPEDLAGGVPEAGSEAAGRTQQPTAQSVAEASQGPSGEAGAAGTAATATSPNAPPPTDAPQDIQPPNGPTNDDSAGASGEADAAAAIDDELMVVDSPAVAVDASVDTAPIAGDAFPGAVPALDALAELAAAMDAPKQPVRQPWTLLPEIGRVAQEMIRSADEKVSIAVAAYNSVDRHIRAIDAALAASSSSLLGTQPGTLPSHHASAAGALPTQSGAAVDPNAPLEDGMVVGLPGTGAGGRKGDKKRRERDRKRKRKDQGQGQADGEVQQVVEPAWEGGLAVNGLKIDPNEPKYCYCNGVSSGVMIACENEDCPREWFHLDCLGLTAEPKGKWWCNDCRPQKKQKR